MVLPEDHAGVIGEQRPADTNPQGNFPPYYTRYSTAHPDGLINLSAGGRVPELWPAGSAPREILGLELGGGYEAGVTVNARLTGLSLELISLGRKEEWLSDGIEQRWR